MVYLLGLGAAVSFYFMYRNKKKISFELLKYYTYIDEFFTKFSNSEDTKFLYPLQDSLVESSNLKPTLINIKNYGFPYIITRDFIVKEENEGKSRKSKYFYKIYQISSDDTKPTEDDNVIEFVKPLKLGIEAINYESEFMDRCFKNQLSLFETIEWISPIIAASISIVDKNKVYTFREFDITEFLCSLLKPNKKLILDNELYSKTLWLHIFNFIFKDKNILIPSGKDDLDNYELSWTVVFDTCDVQEGTKLVIDLSE